MPDACRSCQAPVVWSLTPSGQRAPIDRDPAPNGNVLLIAPKGLDSLLSVVLSGETLAAAMAGGMPLRLNHWASCPDKAEWRERTDAKKHRQEALL